MSMRHAVPRCSTAQFLIVMHRGMASGISNSGTPPSCDGRAGNIPHAIENLSRLRVLVVDDEVLIRWSLRETLEAAGHVVAEAADRESALRSLSTGGPFDVVLLDHRLPDSNDLNLLATIRTLTPWTAVVMMTAFGSPEVMAGALQLGAYRVVPKPFEVQEMAALVLQAHEDR